MEKIYIAKNLIKHNGRRYAEGSEIPLDESSAKRLLELKSVQPTEKTTISYNTPPAPAGDGASPVQESNTGSTPEANPEEQTNPPAYAEMTNNQQIDYLSSLSDEEFKTRYDELFEASKSKSKTFAEKRMKSLNTDNETQE